MPRFIALLRGINVGGNRVILMADLREMFAAVGATEVATYIQSGNVVFTHPARSEAKLATDLEKQIAGATRFDVAVVLRTAAQWSKVIDDNPFGDADADHLHVSFLATAPPAKALSTIDVGPFAPERFVQLDREVYLHLPNGLGRSKLAGTIAKQKSMAGATVRNWRTVLKLQDLAAGQL